MIAVNAFFMSLLSYFSEFDFIKIYIVKLIYSLVQDYRPVLREFTFTLASWQCIVSLFQPHIYRADQHPSARGLGAGCKLSTVSC